MGTTKNKKDTAAEFSKRHQYFVEMLRNESFDDQLNCFMKDITMNNEEISRRYQVIADVRWILKYKYPNVKIHPFGSLITNLGDVDSDLDIFGDVYGNSEHRETSLPKSERIEIFRTVADIIIGYSRRRNSLFRDVVIISRARIPIIKFNHISTNVNCDISFENLLSVRNTQLIKFLIDLDPRIFPLVCLIRYWGKYHQIIDSQKIKNYGLVLLILVFLSAKNIVPSIYKLQHWNPPPERYIIDGWDASFYDKTEEVRKYLDKKGRPPVELNQFGKPTLTAILQLALEFFEFFKQVPAKTHIVCTLTGKFMKRELFLPENEDSLPFEMKSYKNAFTTQTDFRRLKVHDKSAFVIQDPFVLNINVSAGTKEKILQTFIDACACTATNLRRFLESAKRGNPVGDITSMFTALKTNQKKKPQKVSVAAPKPSPEVSIVFVKNPEITKRIFDHDTSLKPMKSFTDLYKKDKVCSHFESQYGNVWLIFMRDLIRDLILQCFKLEVEVSYQMTRRKRSAVERNASPSSTNDQTPVKEAANPFLAVTPKKLIFENDSVTSTHPASIEHVDSIMSDEDALSSCIPKTSKRPRSDSESASNVGSPNSQRYYKFQKISVVDQKGSVVNQDKSNSLTLEKYLTYIKETNALPKDMYFKCIGKHADWEGRNLLLKSIKKLDLLEHQQNSKVKIINPLNMEKTINEKQTPKLLNFTFKYNFSVYFRQNSVGPSIDLFFEEVFHPDEKKRPTAHTESIKCFLRSLLRIQEDYVLYRLKDLATKGKEVIPDEVTSEFSQAISTSNHGKKVKEISTVTSSQTQTVCNSPAESKGVTLTHLFEQQQENSQRI